MGGMRATRMSSLPVGERSSPRTTSCWPQSRPLSCSPLPTRALRAWALGDTGGTQKKRALCISPCPRCLLHRRDLARRSASFEGPTGGSREGGVAEAVLERAGERRPRSSPCSPAGARALLSCAAGACCTYRCGPDGGLSTHVSHTTHLHAKRPILVQLRVIHGPFQGECRLQSGGGAWLA